MLITPSADQRKQARTSFYSVFVSGDPYTEPFSPQITERLLLYPTDNYALTPEQFHALAKAAGSLGEDWAYLLSTALWDQEDWEDSVRELWILELNDLESYLFPPENSSIALAENAIYSPTGSWGILVSDMAYALTGGELDFVETFRELTVDDRNERQMIDEWLTFWSGLRRHGHPCDNWLPSLVRHLYGEEKAAALLSTYWSS
jgi:hypothetical protein